MTQRARLATRGSKLALWQANYVASLLAKYGCTAELNIIKTTGDVVQDRFLHEIGGKGLFVKELEQAMQEQRADFAVHSLKDLPVRLPEIFTLAAVLQRHVVYDTLILRDDHVAKLGVPAGTTLEKEDFKRLAGLTIGSSSLRRQSLLAGLHCGLKLEPVRGNVDTRLEKLAKGNWDAIILAGASLERLGIKDVAAYPIATDWFVPCAAQGALAIETLKTHPLHATIRNLNDAVTETAVNCERYVLRLLGGDCTMPFGCLVEQQGSQVHGQVVVLARDGREARATLTAPGSLTELDYAGFGKKLVQQCLRQGGEAILEALNLPVPEIT